MTSLSSESLSVSLKNIGPFFKYFPETVKESKQIELSRRKNSLILNHFQEEIDLFFLHFSSPR